MRAWTAVKILLLIPVGVFILMLLACLLLVTFVPGIAMWAVR